MKKRKSLSSKETKETKSIPLENEKSESNFTSIIIMIDKDGKIVHNSEVTCHIVYWIADGCVPDINIIIQDDRIKLLRNELSEVEKRIKTESCSEQLTKELLSIKKQLRKIESYDYRVERSVVTKDIPPNVLAMGTPCRVVREITDEDRISDDDFMGI